MSDKKTPEEKKAEIEGQAARLRQARKEIAGYKSFEKFAEDNGISPRTYINHEQGTRGMKKGVAKKYAEFLGVNFDWLYHGKGIPTVGTPSLEDMFMLAKERTDKAILDKGLPNDKYLKSSLGAHIMLKMEKQLEHGKSLEVSDDFIDYVIANLLVSPEKTLKKE